MRKRIVSLLCALTMLVTMMTSLLPAQAAGVTMAVQDVTAAVGGAVTLVDVPITLSGNTGICGVVLEVAYDDALTLTKVTAGAALAGLDYSKPKDLSANPIILLWDGIDEDNSNGEMAVLTFEVPSASAGRYDISLAYDAGGIYDGALDDVDVALKAGEIVVGNASPELSLSTVNGAQIRTSGVQGLRYISSIDKTTADFSRVVEYGTLLIPSADITDISELVIGATLNGHTVAKVPAKNLYAVTDSKITFTAVLTNIREKNYAREYTARAYAILDDGSVVYSDTGASRSIYSVAKRGLENPAESAANKALFQAIVDVVENA